MKNRRDASTDASDGIADCQLFVMENAHVDASLRCQYVSFATLCVGTVASGGVCPGMFFRFDADNL